VIERLAINVSGPCIISGVDVSLDLEVNGFAQPDEHREIILAERLRCLTTGGVSVRHLSKRQELELYLQELAQVGGDVTKAARKLGMKRTTLHMRMKRLERTLARPSTV
jgi:DNA-binding NtrC family response regulator